MTNQSKILVLAAAASALVVASCATKPAPQHLATRAPIHGAYPTPRSPAPVAAAPSAEHSLAVQAAAFESFMRHARAIEPGFTGPEDVAHALQTGAAHEPHELEAGMVAYAAMAALQEPRFVAAVRADRTGLAARIAADPQAALAVPGADGAEARAAGALYGQGTALAGEGEKVKHAAYSVQKAAWANAKIPDAAGRLARVKRISTSAYQPAREDAAELQMSLAATVRRPGAPTPVVARAVALAALSALGEERQGKSLASDPSAASCLRLAKLNLYQCLASAGPHYEDIYCLGQHAMIDPGQCVIEAARGAPSRQVAMSKVSVRR